MLLTRILLLIGLCLGPLPFPGHGRAMPAGPIPPPAAVSCPALPGAGSVPAGQAEIEITWNANAIRIRLAGDREGRVCLDLSAWDTGRQILVIAYDPQGTPLGEIPYRLQEGLLLFDYRRCLAGREVGFYEISQDPLESQGVTPAPGSPPAPWLLLPAVILVLGTLAGWFFAPRRPGSRAGRDAG